jgi:hypothetical protein
VALRTLSSKLTQARGNRRWLHPVGRGFQAVLEVPGGAGTGNVLLDTPGRHLALARLSKALGTPRGWIDAWGLAFTLPEHGQDVLVTTSFNAPVLHRIPFLAPGGPWARPYSSVLDHRIGTIQGMLGALPVRDERAFDLAIASGGERFRAVARLRLGDPLDPEETDRLRLNPWNTGAGIVPVGRINAKRRPVYDGSQDARP